MASSSDGRVLAIGLTLAVAGAAVTVAWQQAMWGSVAGALLAMVWLLVELRRGKPSPYPHHGTARNTPPDGQDVPLRLLLDQLPTPLVGIEAGSARALNRAARALFATQDRIAPTPEPLLSATAPRLTQAGRHWRIDRVEAGGTGGTRAILALIDIEAEERTGEARATAEMIQVMGHEMLNGLAPIVSLVESGLAVWQQPEVQRARLMPEILATLARRTESLQRFTEAYRALARLPDPTMTSIAPDEFIRDLTLLFDGRWRDRIALRVEHTEGAARFMADRDQLTQAVWALLQNAAEAALAGPDTPWVALSIAGEEDPISILVSDNGAGIPSPQRTRIFQPFHTTKPHGTGIGLSLSRHIARAHGGDLHLQDSQPTTFSIVLPRRAVQEP